MSKLSKTTVVALAVMIGIVGCSDGVDAENPPNRRQDMPGADYRFTEKDFQKEIASDELFYIPDGDDDGMKEVTPNLQKMPVMLKDAQALVTGYRPPETGEKRGRIFVYYPESTYKHTIDYVGDGWVVARAFSLVDQRYIRGFIYTDKDDMYVDGQELQHAYYALVGVQKVPLANGSSQSMYAFAKLDSETCRLAFEAYEYNSKVLNATQEENDRREVARREYAYKQERARIEGPYHKELAKVFNGFAFRDIKSQFHFPDELSCLTNEFEFANPGVFNCYKDDNARTENETNFVNAIKSQNWKYVAKCVQRDIMPKDDPIQQASNALRRAYGFTRYFWLPSNKCWQKYREKLDKYRCYVVDRHCNTIELETLGSRCRLHLPVGSDLYCIKKADESFFKKFIDGRDANGFVVAYNEREKFNAAYYSELEKLFADIDFPDVEDQLHCPSSLSPLTEYIAVKDSGTLRNSTSSFEDGPIIAKKDFLKATNDRDWNSVMMLIGYSPVESGNPIQCAKDARTKVSEFGRRICLAPKKYVPKRNGRPGMDEMKEQYCYCIVNRHAPVQLKWVSPKDEDPTILLPVDAELYCVANEDRALFEKIKDVGGFVKTWHEKYREEHFGFGKHK